MSSPTHLEALRETITERVYGRCRELASGGVANLVAPHLTSALSALARVGGRVRSRLLVEKLILLSRQPGSENETIRRQAVRLLGKLNPAIQLLHPALSARLDDENSDVRRETVWVVRALAGSVLLAYPALVATLLERLDDELDWVRHEAAEVVGALAGSVLSVQPVLAEILLARLDQEDWIVRRATGGGQGIV